MAVMESSMQGQVRWRCDAQWGQIFEGRRVMCPSPLASRAVGSGSLAATGDPLQVPEQWVRSRRLSAYLRHFEAGSCTDSMDHAPNASDASLGFIWISLVPKTDLADLLVCQGSPGSRPAQFQAAKLDVT